MWGPTLIFALIGSAVLKFVGYKQTNKTSLFKEEVNELFTVYTFSTPVHYSLHLQYTCTLQCSTKSRKKCAYTLLNKIPEKKLCTLKEEIYKNFEN